MLASAPATACSAACARALRDEGRRAETEPPIFTPGHEDHLPRSGCALMLAVVMLSLATMWFAVNVLIAPYAVQMRQEIWRFGTRLR